MLRDAYKNKLFKNVDVIFDFKGNRDKFDTYNYFYASLLINNDGKLIRIFLWRGG